MKKRKCLILESHLYETGFSSEQVQIPLNIANSFFGSGEKAKKITINVFLNNSKKAPTFSKQITISKEYKNKTRRINGFPELSYFHSSFIFFEQTTKADVYDVWFSFDKTIIAAKFNKWKQGNNSQHFRGRLAIIVDAPVKRTIDHI